MKSKLDNKGNLPYPMMIKLGFNVTIHENLVEFVYESMLTSQHSDVNFEIFHNMPYAQSMLCLEKP